MGKKNRLIQQEAVEGAEERGVFDRKIGGQKNGEGRSSKISHAKDAKHAKGGNR